MSHEELSEHEFACMWYAVTKPTFLNQPSTHHAPPPSSWMACHRMNASSGSDEFGRVGSDEPLHPASITQAMAPTRNALSMGTGLLSRAAFIGMDWGTLEPVSAVPPFRLYRNL